MAKITVLRGASTPAYQADAIAIDLDVSDLAEEIGNAVAEHHREAISSGRRSSGGPQRPLGPDERKRAQKGKRNAERGMGGAGRFPGSIGASTTNGKTRATATISADAFFDDWQEAEASRGVEYLEVDGDVDAAVDTLIDADMRKRGLA